MFHFAYLMVGSSNKNCNEFSQLCIPWPEQAKNVQSFMHFYIQFKQFRFVAACKFSVDYSEIDYNSCVHSNQSQRFWTEVVQQLACVLPFVAVDNYFFIFAYGLWVIFSAQIICSCEDFGILWRKCAKRNAKQWQRGKQNRNINLVIINDGIRCWIRFACAFNAFNNIFALKVLWHLFRWKEKRMALQTKIE